MASFVPITLSQMLEFLSIKAGKVERRVQGREVVLILENPQEIDLRVEIFTSVADGEDVVRQAGADAIRVVAVYDDMCGKRFPLVRKGESTRILRVGSVESILDRLYAAAVDHMSRTVRWSREKSKGVDPTLTESWVPELCP